MKTIYKITGEKWQEKLKGRELTISKWHKDIERNPCRIHVNIKDFVKENRKVLTEDEIQVYVIAYTYGGDLSFELTDLTPIGRKWLSHNSKLTLLFIVFLIIDTILSFQLFKMVWSLPLFVSLFVGLMDGILNVCAFCIYIRYLER